MTQSNPSPPPNDEFYIGYAKIPSGIKKFLLKFVPLLVIGAVVFGGVLPLIHNQYNSGKFSAVKDLEGFLIADPVPQLAVPRPGDTASGANYSRYILSGLAKTAPPAKAMEHAGKWVKLSGAAIFRDNTTLIATRSAEPIDTPDNFPAPPSEGDSLGQFSLKGEILDAKCYMGAMKPGHTKVHRGCAIRCISGGVPPIFITRDRANDPLYLVLADEMGKAVNSRVLDKVGDPVQIKGEVVRYDDLFVLEADPATYEVL